MTSREHEPLTAEERALAARLAGEDLPSPSASLDAMILAASRAAVAPVASRASPADTTAAPLPQSAPVRALQRSRWPFGVGIAASLLVAVGIAWQLRPLPDTTAQVWSEMPAASSQARRTEPVAQTERLSDAASSGAAADDAAVEPLGTHDPVDAADTRVASEALPEAASAVAASSDTKSAAETMREPLHAPIAAAATVPDADTDQAQAPMAERSADMAASAQAVPLPPSQKTAIGNQTVIAPIVRPSPPPPAPPAPAPALVPAPASAASRMTDVGTTGTPPAAAPPAAPRREPAQVQVPQDNTEVQRTRGSHVLEADDMDAPASADAPEIRKAWLARIRELVDDGQIDAARASLAEFHRRHPQVALPDDLRPLLE